MKANPEEFPTTFAREYARNLNVAAPDTYKIHKARFKVRWGSGIEKKNGSLCSVDRVSGPELWCIECASGLFAKSR